MPVSYARRKFVNVLPLDDDPEEDVVLPLELLLLLLPHPAATSASTAAKAAVVTSQLLLRIKMGTSPVVSHSRQAHRCAGSRGRLVQTAVYRRQQTGSG